ncbi:unnamed protein product, partial [Nesidiocoris tenuis]
MVNFDDPMPCTCDEKGSRGSPNFSQTRRTMRFDCEPTSKRQRILWATPCPSLTTTMAVANRTVAGADFSYVEQRLCC